MKSAKWIIKDKDKEIFWPSEELKQKAWVSDEAIYKKAEKDPIEFWAKLGKEGLDWDKKWDKTYVENLPYFSWFVGGKLNASFNCLDRHLEKKKDKIAITWEPEPIGEKNRVLTYNDLYLEVNKFANVLKSLGAKKGDVVGIYLPLIPEVQIAMLACARIGAIHTVVFSAFSAEALRYRLKETEAEILITADGYYRRGKIIDLKKQADEGVKDTKVEKTIVVKRASNEINWVEGRDFWWNELTKDAKNYCEPEIMNSEDTLFILYTSGTTGKPKGILHDTGGYLVQAYWTAKWDFDLHDEDVMWCVPPETVVMTNPHAKPISEISIGDKVLTHTGKFESVEKVFSRYYNGRLIKLTTSYSNVPILLTPNHKVLVLKQKMPHKITWIPAKNLKEGNYVAFPRIRRNREKKYIKISNFLNIKVEDGFALPKKGKKGKIKNKIKIDKNFMKLIGYYIAEGSIAGNDTIQLTFSIKERNLAEDCSDLFKKVFDINSHTMNYKGGIDVRVNSIIIARLFETLFGRTSVEKCLPSWILTLQWNLLQEFIKGYWLGDGSSSKNRRRVRFTTVSEKLAYQVKLILNKLGIIVSLTYISKEKIRKRQNGRKIMSKHDSYELAITGSSSKKLYELFGLEKLKTYSWERGIVTTNLIFFPIRKKEYINYNGLVYNLKTNSNSFALSNITVHNCTADIAWITGHTYACYGGLLNGATIVIYEGAPDFPQPDRWCEIIEKHGVTIFYTAPTAIRMFIKYDGKWIGKHDLSSLRILGSVGEPINREAWLWYFNEVGKGRCPIIDTWWQTETGGTLINALPGIGPFIPTVAGRSFPGTRHEVLDEDGKVLPPGKEGNLVQLSPFAPGMLKGIYKNPKKYFETYWKKYKNKYFTSDGAWKDKKGNFRLTGRVDDVMKVAGHRLATAELEDAITAHPSVAECAVIAMPHEIKGEVPVAFVILKTKPYEQIEKELIKQVEKSIGPIARPNKIFFVEDLPKTRSGKIIRRILKNIIINKPVGDVSTLANPESVEKIKKLLKN